MEMRKLLDIMESMEAGDQKHQGLSALSKILGYTTTLLKSSSSPDITTETTSNIEEGKISNGLVSLAIAGLSTLGAGSATAGPNDNGTEIVKQLSYCAGAMSKVANDWQRDALNNNSKESAEKSIKIREAAKTISQVATKGAEKNGIKSSILRKAWTDGNNNNESAENIIRRCALLSAFALRIAEMPDAK
jgi:hypothetical protein